MQRYAILQQIQQLDPVQENSQICYWMVGYEFPWDMTRALEIALFRTFCIPSISQLLDRTGEFHHHPQKRYDDTGLLIAQILKWGHDSPLGQAAIQRMNRIHGHFAISNADFLYVLSTFIYEPLRWLDRFGWRSPSQVERLAMFYFWRSVGEQMQIQQIPDTYEAFEQFNLDYENRYFRYADANRRVGESVVQMMLGWFPAVLRPALKPWVYAALDDRMLEAFGFPQPTAQRRQVVETVLQLKGELLRRLPPRKHPDFYGDAPQRSYPNGYRLEDLGPPHLLESLNCSQDKLAP
ncbi:MAG TPA: oxygenase MpaB family protein [Coleofasciculaceae cyanobacterium]